LYVSADEPAQFHVTNLHPRRLLLLRNLPNRRLRRNPEPKTKKRWHW
jgi:hypothetical protein